MNISRADIISGPCIITYDGVTFWSRGDVTVNYVSKRFAVETSAFGKLEDRQNDFRVVATFEPAGIVNSSVLAKLWPYASTAVGASIYPATDKAMVIHGVDGRKLSVANAAVTQMPSVRFGTANTQVGTVQFTGLIADGQQPGDVSNYLAWTSEAFPGHTGFDATKIMVAAPQLTWNGEEFSAEAGVEVTFGMRLTEHAVDGQGTVDMKLAGLECTARMIPVGWEPSASAGVAPAAPFGSSPFVSDLVIAPSVAGAIEVQLKSAALMEVQNRWGAPKNIGQTTFAATRGFTQYAAGPPIVNWSMHPLWSMAISD